MVNLLVGEDAVSVLNDMQMIDESKVTSFLESIRVSASGQLRRLEYFSNEDPNRQIYVLDDSVLIKVYGLAELGAWKVECAMLKLANEEGIPSVQLLGQGKDRTHGFIAVGYERSSTFNDIYQKMDREAYQATLEQLGKSVRVLHNLPQKKGRRVPFQEDASPNSELHSRRRLSKTNELIQGLKNDGFLTSIDRESIQIYASRIMPRAFSSREAILHLDVHNENILVSRKLRAVKLIDWEAASVGPTELDLVHPYLNLFGEAFQGRRFYREKGGGNDRNFLSAFEQGYGTAVDWEVVALHAFLWYAELAARSMREGELRLATFYARTGIAGIAYAVSR